MTAEHNRQPEGIPVGGQFATKIKSDDVVALAVAPEPAKTIGRVLSDRYFAAKDQMDAHDQNEWVKDVQEEHPEAAFAHVNVEKDGGGRYTAGVDLYTADGTPLADEDDTAALESDFDCFWDMSVHENAETGALLSSRAEAFSLKSIQDRWAGIESSTEPTVDPFAHLTGMDRAKAQASYALKLNTEAADAYVQDLSRKLLAINPDAARVYVNRTTDVEYGLAFTLDRVEDQHGNLVDVDLAPLQDESFQDVHFDRHVDYDENQGEANGLYVNVDPGH